MHDAARQDHDDPRCQVVGLLNAVEEEKKLKADAERASADLAVEVGRGRAQVDRWRKDVDQLRMNVNGKSFSSCVVAFFLEP